MTLIQECGYEPKHYHEYPDDWSFGGASGTDPRKDERFLPDTYQYLDSSLRVLHTTQVPLCDDEAIDNFTAIARYGSEFVPVYLQVKRAGKRDYVVLPFTYDTRTDLVTEMA